MRAFHFGFIYKVMPQVFVLLQNQILNADVQNCFALISAQSHDDHRPRITITEIARNQKKSTESSYLSGFTDMS